MKHSYSTACNIECVNNYNSLSINTSIEKIGSAFDRGGKLNA